MTPMDSLVAWLHHIDTTNDDIAQLRDRYETRGSLTKSEMNLLLTYTSTIQGYTNLAIDATAALQQSQKSFWKRLFNR